MVTRNRAIDDHTQGRGKAYVGIDIGNNGGFVRLIGGEVKDYAKLPLQATGKRNELDVVALRETLLRMNAVGVVTAVVEECSHHQPSQGAMRSQAMSFGKVIALLELYQIKVIIVSAQKWQNALLGKFPKGTSKAAAMGMARRLWPKQSFILEGCKVPHDGCIDAALIAEWARRERL